MWTNSQKPRNFNLHYCEREGFKSGRRDKRKRGLAYCPEWLEPSIDQRREGKTGWKREGTNRPQGLDPNPLVASALFLSLQAGQGCWGLHQRVLSFHLPGMHTLIHAQIHQAFENSFSWWHHFHLCSTVRNVKSKLICYQSSVKESWGLVWANDVYSVSPHENCIFMLYILFWHVTYASSIIIHLKFWSSTTTFHIINQSRGYIPENWGCYF